MRFRKCVGTLMLVGLLTACGTRSPGGFHPSGHAAPPGDSNASPAGQTSSSGASPDATGGGDTPQPKTPQSALAAYRNYQLAYERAYETNDASVLDPVAMDPMLSEVTQDVADIRAKGVIWRFHNVLNPRVQGTSNDGSSVVILDCVRTLGAYRYDAKTGKRLNGWRGGSREYQAIMRYSDDSWKISEARQGGKC